MPERCWAFLTADFELAARRAQEAVKRLQELASEAAARTASRDIRQASARARLEHLPQWVEAQRAIASQLTALAALEDAGLAVPAESLDMAQRAQAGFERLCAPD